MVSRRAGIPQARERLALGSTGLSVSPIAVGLVEDPQTIVSAFDLGINFFVLSTDMHWPLYEASRRGLHLLLQRGGDIRRQVVVAAVSYVTQEEFSWAPFVELLAQIPGLDRIEVLMAGGAYGEEIFRRLAVYRRNRAEGLASATAIGATFHDRGAALRAISEAALDVAFVRYNPRHPGARGDLFPHLPRQRRSLVYNFNSTVGYRPPDYWRSLGLEDEHWFPDPSDYYRFALTRPELDGLLCAPRSPAELRELIEALAEGPLDQDEEDHLALLCELETAQGRERPASP